MNRAKQFKQGLFQKHIADAQKALLPTWFSQQNPPARPNFVSLTLVNTCFFRCKQCNIWKRPRQKKVFTRNQIEHILISLKDWLGFFQLSLADGEPFLYKDILWLFDRAAELDIFPQVNTNAFLLTRDLVQRVIKSGIGAISISLDSTRPSVHNAIRGNPRAFERVEGAIEALVKLRGKKKFPYLTLTAIILKQNLDELENLVRFTKEKGLDGIHFQPLTHTFYPKHYDARWFKQSSLWPKDYQKVMAALDRLILLKEKGEPIENSVYQLKQYREYFKNADRYGRAHSCHVGTESFLIDAEGNVRFCFEWPPVGNIFETSPEEIWLGKRAQNQREKILKCARDCKVLICNMPMSREEAAGFFLKEGANKLKRTWSKMAYLAKIF